MMTIYKSMNENNRYNTPNKVNKFLYLNIPIQTEFTNDYEYYNVNNAYDNMIDKLETSLYVIDYNLNKIIQYAPAIDLRIIDMNIDLYPTYILGWFHTLLDPRVKKWGINNPTLNWLNGSFKQFKPAQTKYRNNGSASPFNAVGSYDFSETCDNLNIIKDDGNIYNPNSYDNIIANFKNPLGSFDTLISFDNDESMQNEVINETVFKKIVSTIIDKVNQRITFPLHYMIREMLQYLLLYKPEFYISNHNTCNLNGYCYCGDQYTVRADEFTIMAHLSGVLNSTTYNVGINGSMMMSNDISHLAQFILQHRLNNKRIEIASICDDLNIIINNMKSIFISRYITQFANYSLKILNSENVRKLKFNSNIDEKNIIIGDSIPIRVADDNKSVTFDVLAKPSLDKIKLKTSISESPISFTNFKTLVDATNNYNQSANNIIINRNEDVDEELFNNAKKFIKQWS